MIILDTHVWIWWIHDAPLLPEDFKVVIQIPGPFHKDPADQIIVATSRVLKSPLLTIDAKLRAYPDVNLLP